MGKYDYRESDPAWSYSNGVYAGWDEAKDFFLWIITNDEWHYNHKESTFERDGYKSKTVDELYQDYKHRFKINNL